MEKKRSIGVTIFGIIELIIGALVTIDLFWVLFGSDSAKYLFAMLNLPFLIFIWLGVGMLKLKPWARKANIRALFALLAILLLLLILFSLGVFSGNLIARLIPLLLIAALFCAIFYPPIYFLKHPKVKAQFE